MRRLALFLSAGILSACSTPAPAPAPQPEAAPAAAPAEQADQLVMSGIKLYLYEGAATPGQERKPSFSVEADEFVQAADKAWRFKEARATVPSKTEGQPPIIFDAGTGQLQEEQSAVLQDGVKATVGPMTIEMQDVHWDQAAAEGAGMASSDSPVSVIDPTTQLFAQQFRLYPADATFLLMEVHGEVSFAPPQQEGADAQEAAPGAPAQEGSAPS